FPTRRSSDLNYSAGIVAAENKTASVGVILHRSPKGALSIPCHVVSFVQNKDLERNACERGHSCKLFHSSPDHVYSTFITRIQFFECVLESFPEQIMCET